MEGKTYNDKFNVEEFGDNLVAQTLDEIGAPADTPAPAKPKKTVRENGKAKTKAEAAPVGHTIASMYFLVSDGDKVTIELDGRRAAAQAILNPAITLYRAEAILPDSVFAEK